MNGIKLAVMILGLALPSLSKDVPPATVCNLITVSNNFSNAVSVARLPEMQSWDMKFEKPLWISRDAKLGSVTAIDSDSSGRVVVTGSWGSGMGIWNGETGQHIRSIEIEDIRALDLNDAGNKVAVATEGARLYIISLDGSEPELLQSNIRSIPWDVAFSPDGQRLAVANGEVVEIWDLHARSIIRTLRTRPARKPWFDHSAELWRQVWQVRFSPDGTRLASGTDGYIQLWDVGIGQELAFVKSGGRPGSLKIGKDSTHVAWANWNEEIRLWAGNKNEPRIYKANALLGRAVFSPMLDQALYPDGRSLISLSMQTGRAQLVVTCETPKTTASKVVLSP